VKGEQNQNPGAAEVTLDDLIVNTFSFPEWKRLCQSMTWSTEKTGGMFGTLSFCEAGKASCLFEDGPEKFISEKSLQELVTLLLKSNGQGRFLESLFRDATVRSNYEIRLQFDFVPNKAAFRDHLELHKDGHPLKRGLVFFSLLFLNEKEILGPEFVYDTEQYSDEHTDMKLWPENLSSFVSQARRLSPDGMIHATRIEAYGCLSMCDPLAFHSTPALEPRRTVKSWEDFLSNVKNRPYGRYSHMIEYEIALAMLDEPENLVSKNFCLPEDSDYRMTPTAIRHEGRLPPLDYQAWCLLREENLDELEGLDGEIDQFLWNQPLRVTGRVVDVSHDWNDSIRYMRDLGLRNREQIAPAVFAQREALNLASSRAYL